MKSHKFRLDLGGLIPLNQMVRDCELDIVANRLRVSFHETEGATVLPLLLAIKQTARPFICRLEFMKGSSNEKVSHMFIHGLTIVEHRFALSYGDSDIPTHVTVFQFNEISSR